MNEQEQAAADAAAAEAAAAEAEAAAQAEADKAEEGTGKGDDKSRKREGYESRQLQKQLEDLRKENEAYKRRDDEARKAKLTDEQKLKEERDALAEENTRLRTEGLKSKIAAEYKLPESLASRLVGTDEAALRADAEDLAKLLPKTKVGTTTDPAREAQGQKKTYTRAQLAADPVLARSADVKLAAKEGRIVG